MQKIIKESPLLKTMAEIGEIDIKELYMIWIPG